MRLTVALWLLFAALCTAAPEDAAVQVKHYELRSPLIDNGSGTVVRSSGGVSWVLTNNHVVPDPGRKVEVLHGGKVYEAAYIAGHAGLDLAMIRVGADLPVATLADAEPEAGTTLRQWGHAGGRKERTPKSGPALGIDGRRAVPHGGEVYRVGITSESGDSGCGVFDPGGKLVAVCWGGGGGIRQCCVRLADVKAFVATHAK